AHATHGETVTEVLGNGDPASAFQHFTLRQPPLTYVSGATDSGGESTLEVRVNDVHWHEKPFFYDHAPNERIFVARRGDDRKTTLVFGSGTTGSRLPSGIENVRATYRKGTGQAGNVKADHLTQLLKRPLGVTQVKNPLPAAGGDDP